MSGFSYSLGISNLIYEIHWNRSKRLLSAYLVAFFGSIELIKRLNIPLISRFDLAKHFSWNPMYRCPINLSWHASKWSHVNMNPSNNKHWALFSMWSQIKCHKFECVIDSSVYRWTIPSATLPTTSKSTSNFAATLSYYVNFFSKSKT